MMRRSDVADVESFLSRHATVRTESEHSPGDLFGRWRVTAFLGRGGCGEVYRVVHVETGEAAALKTAYAGEEHHVARINREADFLSGNRCVFFPRFYGRGDKDGVPYLVMELLEDGEIPHADKEVADFLLAICEAVNALHRRGFVHRDIKPSNVMFRPAREANGRVEPVLIDLGLLKRFRDEDSCSDEMPSVTLVDGHAAGAGTPRYAAPEQFNGGCLTPVADIHALGVLADECFGGRPPRIWARIISRATSSLPKHRYRDVVSFMRAIRNRHRLCFVGMAAALALTAMCVLSAMVVGRSDADLPDQAAILSQSDTVSSFEREDDTETGGVVGFGENMMTNVVSEELISVEYKTDSAGAKTPYSWRYRVTTNAIPVTLVRLENQEKVFKKPLKLEPGREYRIVGPGILDAAFEKPNAAVRVVLENCFFNNRSSDPPETAEIRYVLSKRSEMNFSEFENKDRGDNFYDPYDYWSNTIYFGKKDALEYFRRRLKKSVQAVVSPVEEQ